MTKREKKGRCRERGLPLLFYSPNHHNVKSFDDPKPTTKNFIQVSYGCRVTRTGAICKKWDVNWQARM